VKLVGVKLHDFRGFPGEFALELKDGCNLLLHGENGSGKSSLAIALREFFSLERPFPRPIDSDANVFANPPQPVVRLTFSSDSGNEEITWESGHYHPLEFGSDPEKANPVTQQQREALMAVSRCSGFFDYRALLRASLLKTVDSLPEQLFLLFVENLLAGFRTKLRGGERYLGELWSELEKTMPKSRRYSHIQRANGIAKQFDDAFRPFLAQVTEKANEYLPYFPENRMKIGFDYPGSSFAKSTKLLTGKSVNPVIEFNGKKVDGHHEFLNEARLTALALSVFLAAVKLADSDPANPEPLRLLVLDDVLIGLDLNNRLPLLELLRREFPRHQIVLFTHDLVWFEIAKEHTTDWGSWSYARLFEEPSGPAEAHYPRFERLKPNMEDLQVAAGYLYSGDLRAAAVYIRAAFESHLKRICEDNGIEVSFKKNTRHVTANALWGAILRRHSKRLRAHRGEFLDPGLIPRISVVRSTVLNRLIHSGSSSLTPAELATALQIITDFRNSEIPFVP
jgi:energy-coupling factor transporter ATP-binding protein EcfA2